MSTFARAAALMVVAALAACQSAPAPDCIRGTLRLEVELKLYATMADSITVQSTDAPTFTNTYAHKPDALDTDLFDIDLTLPNGYPTNSLVTLFVSALENGQAIDQESVQVHTLPVCTVAAVTLINFAPPFIPTDGGAPGD